MKDGSNSSKQSKRENLATLAIHPEYQIERSYLKSSKEELMVEALKTHRLFYYNHRADFTRIINHTETPDLVADHPERSYNRV